MTLAANVILQGLILVYTGGSPTPSAPALIKFLSVGRIGPIPVIALIWLALTLLATLLLSKAAFGRHLYALGTSATVAEFSGVPTARTTVLTYVISGLTAALAGMLLTGYSGQAYLGMGDAYLFTSIAAVAIGGASILGGSGHYLGTVAGALVLTILTGLLPALNLSSGALLIVYGAVILITVSIGSEAFAGIGGSRCGAGTGKGGGLDMVEITCVVDAQGRARRRHALGPEGGRALVDRHLAEADPPLRPGDRQGRDLRGAGISRLPRVCARRAAWCSPWRAASISSIPTTGVFEPIADPEARYAGDALQRRQAGPAGPLLVGHDVRGAGQADRIRRRALPDGPGPLGPQDDRGRRLLQRACLQPGQPDHVFLRQPLRPRRRL